MARDNLKKVIGGILLLMLVLAAVSAYFQLHRADNIQQALAETRRTLRDQGFRTDLADFNFTTDSAMRAREGALTFFAGYPRGSAPAEAIDLLPSVTDGSAVIIWKEDWLKSGEETITWKELSEALEANDLPLDNACEAALGGPIQYHLEANKGAGMMLRHLAALRRLEIALGNRLVAELHDNHPEAAWTNLLALTRVVSAWKVEPVEVSHLVQFSLFNTAYKATWQALQHDWPDEKLAALQREWEATDFFTNFPDTCAFRGASVAALCEQQRHDAGGMPAPGMVKSFASSPLAALSAMKQSWNEAHYRSYGTYDDEKNLLLFYQQREQEARRAITAKTWLEMRALPGVTNLQIFKSPYPSRIQNLFTMPGAAWRMITPTSTPLARAANAEAQRRVIIAAIALERFRPKHGAYPKTLAELAPEFLKAAPVDFVDGQLLRYRPAENGHFELYSLGLDGKDDGGKLPAAVIRPVRSGTMGAVPAVPGLDEDIVWPRPAEAEATATLRQQEADEARTKADDDDEREAAWRWPYSDQRQAEAEKLLAAPTQTNVPDFSFQGRSLRDWLVPPSLSGTNELQLIDLLTLHQITNGSEPETVAFELPLAYDAATNLGRLTLMIDPDYDAGGEEGSANGQTKCERAANGNCRLVWQTIYESPGRHAIQAAFFLNHRDPDKPDLAGPFLAFGVSNLCQFTAASAQFQPAAGAKWHARLPESNATFSVELTTAKGRHLKTLAGKTTDGEIRIYWDLVDEQGERFTGEEFNSVFHLSFPDSGRTQTLRGP